MYKIYKIVDNTNDNVYIGITTQTLKRRLNGHKHKITCSSRNIIKNGDYRIELIEETDDKSRERHWIENTECINITIPGRTKKEWSKEYSEKNKERLAEKQKEWREENKDKILEWREENKDKILEYSEKNYEKNKEKIAKKHKEYYENNKEKIAKQMKEYHKKNKEKLVEYNKEWRKDNKEYHKEYNKIKNNWMSSMGGRPDLNNMSLLKIDPYLFN